MSSLLADVFRLVKRGSSIPSYFVTLLLGLAPKVPLHTCHIGSEIAFAQLALCLRMLWRLHLEALDGMLFFARNVRDVLVAQTRRSRPSGIPH